MEFQEVVRRRRMVRRYDPDRAIPVELRQRIIANAQRAPSAGFSQGWGFLVLEEPADRELFWSATGDDEAGSGSEGSPKDGPADGPADSWLADMRTAPLLVVALSHKDAYLDRYAEPDKGWADRDEARWPVPYWDVDTGMAALLMLLTAVDLGLGACFFGVPPERHGTLREAFGVPDAYTPVGVVSVGYAVPDRPSPSLRRGHRAPEDVVHVGRWRSQP